MPTTRDDVWLCLHLYEQRREPELRAARAWMGSFMPKSFKDIKKVIDCKAGPDANRWWRQSLSYWEMVSALMLADGISDDCRRLFAQTTKEWFFTYSKIAPYLGEIRAMTRPTAFSALEAFCRSFPEHDEWMDHFRAAGARMARAGRTRAAPKAARRGKRG